MIQIDSYLNDGANWQAQMILAYIRGNAYRILDNSYDYESNHYGAEITVHRYINGRENGYVFALRIRGKQYNFAVFEACNSDSIFVIENDELFFDNATYEIVRNEITSKYDCTKRFNYKEFVQCGEYIIDRMISIVDKYYSSEK